MKSRFVRLAVTVLMLINFVVFLAALQLFCLRVGEKNAEFSISSLARQVEVLKIAIIIKDHGPGFYSLKGTIKSCVSKIINPRKREAPISSGRYLYGALRGSRYAGPKNGLDQIFWRRAINSERTHFISDSGENMRCRSFTGIAKSNFKFNRFSVFERVHLIGAGSHPSSLILMEVIKSYLERSVRLISRGFASCFDCFSLIPEPIDSIVYSIVDISGAGREISSCLQILLGRICADSSGSNQLVSLVGAGFGVLPSKISEYHDASREYKLYYSVGFVLQEMPPPVRFLVAFILVFGGLCSFYIGLTCAHSQFSARAFYIMLLVAFTWIGLKLLR